MKTYVCTDELNEQMRLELFNGLKFWLINFTIFYKYICEKCEVYELSLLSINEAEIMSLDTIFIKTLIIRLLLDAL